MSAEHEDGALPAVGEVPSSAYQLLRRVRKLQEDRSAAYHDLGLAFSSYVDDEDRPTYLKRCGDVTARFQAISAAVRSAATELDDAERREEARLVRQLQDLEREKLTVTAARDDLAVRFQVTLKQPHAVEYVSQERSQRGRLGEIVEEIALVLEELRYAEEELRDYTTN